MEVKTIQMRFSIKSFNEIKKAKEKLEKRLDMDMAWEEFMLYLIGQNMMKELK